MADDEIIDTPPADPAPEPTPDPEPAPNESDWRGVFKDEAVRKEAEKSTDPDHFGKRLLEMRKQLSSAIVKPGKDATEEQIAAYRKAMEVPDAIDGYEFPETEDEAVKAEHSAWAEKFHALNIPAPAAKELIGMASQIREETQAALAKADKEFVEAAVAENKAKWGQDYEKNVKGASRAAERVLGEDFEAARQIQTSDGNFVLDHPVMVRAFASIFREMGEGTLGAVTEGDRESLQEQAKDYREKAEKAHKEGDRAKANMYSEKEREIYARLNPKAA